MSRLNSIKPILQKARALQNAKPCILSSSYTNAQGYPAGFSARQRRNFSSETKFTGGAQDRSHSLLLAAGLSVGALAVFVASQDEDALAQSNRNLEGHNFPGSVPIDIEVYKEASRLHYAGVVAHIDGNFEESARCHRRAIELRSRRPGPDSAYDLAQSLGSLSGTLLRAGKSDEALEPTESAVENFKTVIDTCEMDMKTLESHMALARKNATGPLEDAPETVPAWISDGRYHDSRQAPKANKDDRAAHMHSHYHAHHQGQPVDLEAQTLHRHAAPHRAHGAGSPHGAIPHFRPRHKPGSQLSTLSPLLDACKHFNKGVELNEKGKYEEAAEEFGRVVAIRKSELEDDDWYEVAQALAAQGVALLRANKHEEAYRTMSEAKSVYKCVVQSMYPNTSGFLVYLADIHTKQHKFQQAYKDVTEALELVKLTPGQPMLAYTHMKVGLAAEAMGKSEDALVNLEAAWENMKPWMRSSRKGGDVLNQIGSLLIESANKSTQTEDSKKEFSRAREYLQQSLEVNRKLSGDASSPQLATICSNIGEAAFGEGKLEDALQYFSQAKEMRSKSLGERSPFVGLSILSLGKTELARGNYEQARAHFHECADILGVSTEIEVLRTQQAPATLGHSGFTAIEQLVSGLTQIKSVLNN